MKNNIQIQSWNVKLLCDSKFPVINVKNSEFLREYVKFDDLIKLKILNSNYPTDVLTGEIVDEKFRSRYQIDKDLVPILIHTNWLGYPIGYKGTYITLINESNNNKQYVAINQDSDNDSQNLDTIEKYEKEDTDKNTLYITTSIILIILLSIFLYAVNR
tara:strand:- start:76 stop:552 length:477 start_codon:yes stop_codon:yes gene_type:complete